MRNILAFCFIAIFLILISTPINAFDISQPISATENCKIVNPQFGVVSCEVYYGSSTQTQTLNPSCENNFCSFTFSCAGKAECEIDKTNIDLKCDTLYYTSHKIYKDGNLLNNDNLPNIIKDFNELIIVGSCELFTFGSLHKKSFLSTSKVSMTFKNIYLYDETPDWPEHRVEESVGCMPQGIISKSISISDVPSSWVDDSGNTVGTKPFDFVNSIPTMDVGETYSYFYDWREISGINAVVSKNGEIVGYCGGSLGNRKLMSYTQINQGGSCYLIPTSVKNTVECCYNEDCKWSGKDFCDPTSFTCTDDRPCDSDLNCQVLGETTCQNNVIRSWSCDLSKEWYPYKGTCVEKTEQVMCCSDADCSVDQYCDQDIGCKERFVLKECPTEKCCLNGGDYKERPCTLGLECCTASGGIVGECKETCEIIEEQTSLFDLISPKSNNAIEDTTSGVSLSSGSDLIFIILAVVLVAIAFIITKNQKTINIKKIKRKPQTSKNITFCEKCGNELKHTAKFCGMCGKKIEKDV